MRILPNFARLRSFEFLSPSLMIDKLNYIDIYCMETVHFFMFGQKSVPCGIHKMYDKRVDRRMQ